MKALHINGNDLTLEAVREIAVQRRSVLLAPEAREGVNRARAVVDALVANNQLSYAITTGVGKLSDVRIAGDQIRELQVNLVRSHAVGVGDPLSAGETRAMMLLRANSLAKGYSGIRALVIDQLCEMLDRRVTPFVPSQGSVGASGDLAPLAHLALALIGEGECLDENGKRIPSADALRAAQIRPLVLEAKEAVSLINGTQAMLAVGTLALLAAETLADSADVIGSMTLDALRGTDVAFDDRIHRVRPHAGQLQSAANLRRMLEGRFANRIVIAAGCKMPTRCDASHRCTARCVTRLRIAEQFSKQRRTRRWTIHWYSLAMVMWGQPPRLSMRRRVPRAITLKFSLGATSTVSRSHSHWTSWRSLSAPWPASPNGESSDWSIPRSTKVYRRFLRRERA